MLAALNRSRTALRHVDHHPELFPLHAACVVETPDALLPTLLDLHHNRRPFREQRPYWLFVQMHLVSSVAIITIAQCHVQCKDVA